MALQLQPVNSFTEQWQRCSEQIMCQPQSAAKSSFADTFQNKMGGAITNVLAPNRASLHLVNILLGETSLIFLPSSSKKLCLPFSKPMLMRNERGATFPRVDIPDRRGEEGINYMKH